MNLVWIETIQLPSGVKWTIHARGEGLEKVLDMLESFSID